MKILHRTLFINWLHGRHNSLKRKGIPHVIKSEIMRNCADLLKACRPLHSKLLSIRLSAPRRRMRSPLYEPLRYSYGSP